jgi:hypothetical protein
LSFDSIHACINNCVLFKRGYKDLQHCLHVGR